MRFLTLGIAVYAGFVACAMHPLFPEDVTEGVETHFDFDAWRAEPTTKVGRKVQLGGRILEGQSTDQGTLIIVKQLPIIEHPAYGPTDHQRKRGVGTYQFAVLYVGKIDSSALSAGNRFIAIGNTQSPRPVTVDGATRTAPLLLAQCIHIWETRGVDVADFQSAGAGYGVLEEATYCADRPTIRPSP